MDSQQPIKQKDLQTADEFLRALSPGTEGFAADLHRDRRVYRFVCNAMDRYATYREQLAKHAGFIEGSKQMKDDVVKAGNWVSENIFGVSVSSISRLPLPTSPYEPREKGGEDGV